MLGGFLPKFSVRQIDKGWDTLKKAARTVRDGDMTVKVGILGSKKAKRKEGEGPDNVELAFIHEFGTSRIPSRSFIRSTYDRKREDMYGLIRSLVPALYDQRMTVPQLLGLVGAKLAAEMKNTIREGIAPPLSMETIQRRVGGMLTRQLERAYDSKQGWKGIAAVNRVRERQEQTIAARLAFGDGAGGAVPLLDTGQLVNAISWEVTR